MGFCSSPFLKKQTAESISLKKRGKMEKIAELLREILKKLDAIEKSVSQLKRKHG